jgi:hypothetical protein
MQAPSAAFHSHAVKSSEPANSTEPRGCQRSHSTPPPGPSRVRSSEPWFVSLFTTRRESTSPPAPYRSMNNPRTRCELFRPSHQRRATSRRCLSCKAHVSCTADARMRANGACLNSTAATESQCPASSCDAKRPSCASCSRHQCHHKLDAKAAGAHRPQKRTIVAPAGGKLPP